MSQVNEVLPRGCEGLGAVVTLATLAPGTRRWADSWSSLTSQHSLIGEPRALSQTQGVWLLTKGTSVTDFWPPHAYLCTRMHLHTRVYLQKHKIASKVDAMKEQDSGVQKTAM